jgi:cyclopropane-fatty-acyl-phospholipid synthase
MATSNAIRAIQHPIISRVLDELLADYGKQDFRIRLWDGVSWGPSEEPKFTLVINNPEGLRTLFISPTELSLGEAYITGAFDVEGDMEASFELGDFLLARGNSPRISQLLLAISRKSPSLEKPVASARRPTLEGPAHSRQRDMQAIRYHYDLPPEFFALWLDRHMMYSCAYFADGDSSDLDAAQDYKLEYVCRKLGLRPGDHLLDIGCGWGGLIMYAAAQHGVHAHGITLGIRQGELARQRIHNAGLDDRCRVEVCDYRDIECAQRFDKIVSIGMFEHVGKAFLPEYFKRVWQLLRAGGVFLNSGIACAFSHSQRNVSSFVDRYVFPDGELIPVSESLRAAEAHGFEVRDVESLREHYAITLRQWVRRLEAHSETARNVTDETTYRIWRLYMAGSAHQFRSGALNLYHTLLAKPQQNGSSGMPLTRADWYD